MPPISPTHSQLRGLHPFVAGGFGLYFVAMKWMFRFYDIQERSITFEELLLQKLDRRDRDTAQARRKYTIVMLG